MIAFGRSLKNVYSLLANGEQARAYEVLINIKTRKSKDLLELAMAFSFFDNFAKGRNYLELALTDSQIATTANYKALDFLYNVLEEKDIRIDSRIMSLLSTKDNIVKLNVGRGLFLSASYRRAIRALSNTSSDGLPKYLQDLKLSLLATSYAKANKFVEAADSYQALINQTDKDDTSEEKLLLAECLLQAAKPELAFEALNISTDDVEQNKRLFYLRGVALHYLNRYQESLIELRKSYLLYKVNTPYELLLAIARLNIDLQDYPESNNFYKRTLEIIPEHHKQQIMHEYARFLKDQENYSEAIVLLKELAQDMRYKNKIVAELDLAEIAFEMKDLVQANKLVRRPYSQGLLGASILLARISMENFDYDDAIVYLEQVLAISKKASFDWLSAQVLLAEVFAKKKSANPDRLIMHAKNALDYLEANDDWTMTLESYLEEARAEAIENRVVN